MKDINQINTQLLASNELLKNNNYDIKLVNAGVEAQSTAGIILGFKNCYLK